MAAPFDPGRRDFLKVSALAGGGFAIGCLLPGLPGVAEAAGAAESKLNAYIRISSDDTVTLVYPATEMGQGSFTGLPAVIAEELDADWSKTRVEYAPVVDPVYFNPQFGAMLTGGSRTMRAYWKPLRKAGAAAREMLVAAAAQTWNVDPSECRTEKSAVIHKSGKKLSYGKLAEKAAAIPVPESPKLKEAQEFKLIGRPIHRLDAASKSNGTAKYTLDVRLPGMLTALVARPPVVGGKVASFDAGKAKAVPGVKHVVEIPSGVAVVADGFWAASQGRDALEVKWDDGALAGLSSEDIRKSFAADTEKTGLVSRKVGDVNAVKPAKTIEAVYEEPYLAHACMEPLNAVAWVKPGSVEVWGGTQSQSFAQAVAAQISGVDPKNVKVNLLFLGGGFGRRAAQDHVADAVHLSKALGVPVKAVYTREDDIRGGFYRPAFMQKFTGGLDASGKLVSLTARAVGPSILAHLRPDAFEKSKGNDPFATDVLKDAAYDIPNVYVDWVRNEPGPTVWVWRSVGHSTGGFAFEGFINELAHAAGKDPFEFRRAMLEKSPRHRKVLETAAEGADWAKPLPAGVGRGIALVESFGSIVSQVVEASVDGSGKPKVHRVVVAIDCGMAVNPADVEAQMNSGVVYAMSAALYGKLTLKDGRIQQSNFHDYPVVRIPEAPKVEVHIVNSGTEELGGVGEPGVPPFAPALAEAMFAVTGKRIRSLPIEPKPQQG